MTPKRPASMSGSTSFQPQVHSALMILVLVQPIFGAVAYSADITSEELTAVKAAESARVRAIESVYGAVVAIYGNDRQGGGSGVLFDPAGYALTNHHVIAGAGEGGWAGLADGKLYRWKLIGTDPGGDVAIIKLEGKDAFPAAPLGDSDTVRVGDWAMAMGNPFVLAEDQKPTVTLGIVSGVKRFQEGSGLNQLVYGNCIQVDSSINPGNSGGPLFNIRGQIVGINGRGSFEERGRVNVGLGYAISSNQIKTFIPELLATKIAQHGTLDAMFSNRDERVICYTLNLDSAAAKAGLALGDRLVSFEGVPIRDANEFTNLLTTYPAGWPAEVVFEHEGKQKTIHVRLAALPYERYVRPPMQPGGKPSEKPKSDDEKKPAEPKPGEPPAKPERPEFPLHDAGKIRDAKLNWRIAEQVVAAWRGTAKESTSSGLKIESEIRRDNQVVGNQTITIASGGRLRVEYDIDGKRTIIACDGKECWNSLPDRESRRTERGKAFLNPHFAQGIALSIMLGLSQAADWGELALDGADKAGGHLCYRLSITDKATSEQLYIWLRPREIHTQSKFQLVKTGVGLDDDETIESVVYEEFLTSTGTELPQLRRLVHGIAENTGTVISMVAAMPGDVDSRLFAMPE
jgi:serine protease Do